MEQSEYDEHADQAAKYYLGLWNLLKQAEAPPPLIINAAINNMLAILDHYMTGEEKVTLMEKILSNTKEETSLEIDQQH